MAYSDRGARRPIDPQLAAPGNTARIPMTAPAGPGQGIAFPGQGQGNAYGRLGMAPGQIGTQPGLLDRALAPGIGMGAPSGGLTRQGAPGPLAPPMPFSPSAPPMMLGMPNMMPNGMPTPMMPGLGMRRY